MNSKANSGQRVLILTGQLGDGHRQAACAIVEAWRELKPGAEVHVVDYLEWTHPHLHELGTSCYKKWVTTMPSMYGYLFELTRRQGLLSKMFRKLRLFRSERMMALLDEVRPDVVVSTLPAAAGAMSFLKEHGLTSVPTVTVITDHTDHSYWLHPHTDRYLVGSQRTRRMLINQQVPGARIEVTGIPVRRQFCSVDGDRAALRERLGLKANAPVVLVMGGGFGMIGLPLLDLLTEDDLPDDLQFVIVCGRNEKLLRKLTAGLGDMGGRIILTGYVDNVHEWMAAADLIVTKPGGLTVSEAQSLALPMLLFQPLPGQEQDNADYLVEAGVALQAYSRRELATILISLFQNPQLLTTIRNRAKRLQTESASANVVSAIALACPAAMAAAGPVPAPALLAEA
ncbi:MAG: glycosyltransferase [Paenibacillaceae bacterium]|nr:glycosyltransferase [Paenibacillaceae bacterium]